MDFAAFDEDVSRRAEAGTSAGYAYIKRDAAVPAAVGKGLEFHKALASTVGKPAYGDVSEAGEMSQSELARAVAPQVNKYFNEYDSGE